MVRQLGVRRHEFPQSTLNHQSDLLLNSWESPKMYPPKLYSGPTIQSRSAARRAAQDLVKQINSSSEDWRKKQHVYLEHLGRQGWTLDGFCPNEGRRGGPCPIFSLAFHKLYIMGQFGDGEGGGDPCPNFLAHWRSKKVVQVVQEWNSEFGSNKVKKKVCWRGF